MVSLLAWPRALAILFLLSTSWISVAAQLDTIFTSSVTYCNPPETLLIQRFELAYFPSNASVSFNVSAASVQPNVNVSANVFLNVYGMNPVNFTLDLCGILHGALCPLPMYNFTGADSLTLPQLGVLQQIPGIAYKIPDLEGFAQLTLTDIKTGKVRACVQATLSNGRSAHQKAVEWTTGGVTLAALVVAVLYSIVSPESIVHFRFLELLYLLQSISSSAFLNLNYSSVYRAFALNFAWAMGLISSSSASGLQNSIDHMRHLTGGKLADATGDAAVGLVNRKLSPYNAPSSNVLAQSFGSFLSKRALFARDTISNGDVQTVTAASSNILEAGVPIYVNTVHIATANAFMTVFLIVLCLLAITMAVAVVGYGILLLLAHTRSKRQRLPLSFDYNSFVFSWFLRGLAVAFPLLVFIFYQWTLKDSWLSIFLSVLSLIAIAILLVYPSFLTLRRARRESFYALYDHKEQSIHREGPLFAQYRPPRYYFFLPLLVAFVLRAIFISFAKASGAAQIALLIIVEFGLVVSHFVLKPAKTRGGDVFSTYLAIVRLVCTALMIAFLENIEVKAIPRVVIGIVIALVWAVAVVITIANFVWNAVAGLIPLLRKSNTSSTDSPGASDGSMLEKTSHRSHTGSSRSKLGTTNSGHSPVSLSYGSSIEEIARSRPVNPTPENNSPFDPYLSTPFPISPTTTVTTMEPPSLSSRDSGTITVGSLLPRRWSFSLSQPGSPEGSYFSHQQQTSSMAPSPMPPSSPSEGSHSSGVVESRTNSMRASYQHQQRHADIAEEDEGSLSPSTTVKPTLAAS
ncbi:TRP-domain-containing protein [Agrocybe pediades]|nr:TRP-domain-containing protein [Agrocybe pediades]